MGNRILLADDSITIQKVVNLTFADENIEVVSVSNGDMAEKRLNEVNPDLVLADIFMPGKNGYELCESIKQSPQFGNVPVVLLVGAFEPFDQAEARRVRADAHLTKPFESRTLVETVRKLINTTDPSRTESLSAPTPAEQQGERKAEEQASGPMPEPSLKPDTSGMTAQPASAPPERQEAPGRSSEPAAAEGAPASQDQGMAYDVESLEPLELQLAPEPYQEQTDFSSTPLWMDHDEATTPVSANEADPSDAFDLATLENSARDSDDSPSMAAVESSDTPDLMSGFENVDLDLEPLESELAAGFRIDNEEMVLDLERPDAAYTHEAENVSVGILAPGGVYNHDSGGLQSEQVHATSWADSDSLKTQMLEPPALFSRAEERINTNPLERPPASDFDRPSAAPTGFAEMYEEESSSSTLLTVDDPLGDILMDEPGREVFSYEAQRSPQLVYSEQPANEEFNLEFNPQEQEVFELPQPAVTAARITGELIEPPLDSSEEPSIAIGSIEREAEPNATSQEPVIEAQPQASYESAEANSGSEPSTATTSEVSERYARGDWSESGFEFDSEFHTATPKKPSDEVGYAFDGSKENVDESAAPAHGAQFTTSAMWNEQEARFAPIDVEATSVDESEAAPGLSERDGLETGFEIAPSVEEEPSHIADAPAAQALHEVESHPAEAAAETADLSPALIDEIVRRVVSQMSESVVREIAWEVVPDVVERVIKEMTRDEVSKRI